MDETNVRKYALLMKELGLTGLEITDTNMRVRLERDPGKGQERTGSESGLSALQMEEEAGTTGAPSLSGDDYPVKSSIVGVFYTSPAENEDPYVSVGDHVVKGQTLCIIEAMKLMNEITADEDGVVTQVLAANGQVVEYGTELFRIRRRA